MPNPANDAPAFRLVRKDDGVWILPKGTDEIWSLLNLGPYEQVAEIMANFLAEQDYGE